MVSTKWVATALVTVLSVSSTGVLAAPKPPVKADADNVKRVALPALATGRLVTIATANPTLFTRVPTLATLYTTTRSTTLPVYTLPTTTRSTTTPGYGYTPPGTTTTRPTTVTSRTSSTSGTPTYIPITGANNTCYNRLEIRNLQQTDPDQFNMLLLAWSKIQSAPDSDPFGHYQISGIHGAPYTTWQMGPGSYDYSRGYCTHGSVIFTTWHRPYLLVLEQSLFHTAHAIANTFTGAARTQYLAAAGRLRLPYWDWSSPTYQSYLPPITMVSTVTVTRPDGSGNPVSASINNPLFAYNFLGASSVAPFPAPWNSRYSTRRYPTSSWGDQSNLASNAMQSGFSGRVTQTFNAFLSTTYNQFSNRVEGIHDAVHGALGGGGQMGYVAYSAFDPIFYLHHCNVDRLMAMFQSSSPAPWIVAAPAVGTFARPVPPNVIDDTNSELYPFRRADGTWWRSGHTRPVSTIWTQNYGYPEVPCSYRTRTPEELDTFTTQQINTLYGNGRTIPGNSRDWQVRLIIDQAEIPGGYDVYVYGSYGGQPPQDPYYDPYRKGYLGSLSSMSPGESYEYKQSRIRYVDVSLNSYLRDYGYYEADPYQITSYLAQDLYYTVIANGKPCPITDLYTIKIALYSRDVYSYGKVDTLPYYSAEPYYYLNVTSKIPGGAKSLEEILYPVKVDGTREAPWADFNSTRTDFNSTLKE